MSRLKSAATLIAMTLFALLGCTARCLAATAVEGFITRKLKGEQCISKAIHAMTVRQKFDFAKRLETKAPNTFGAYGRDDKSFVMVYAVDMPEGLKTFVLTLSTTVTEAKRVGHAVRRYIESGNSFASSPGSPHGYVPPEGDRKGDNPGIIKEEALRNLIPNNSSQYVWQTIYRKTDAKYFQRLAEWAIKRAGLSKITTIVVSDALIVIGSNGKSTGVALGMEAPNTTKRQIFILVEAPKLEAAQQLHKQVATSVATNVFASEPEKNPVPDEP
jgi:hypothetical protein